MSGRFSIGVGRLAWLLLPGAESTAAAAAPVIALLATVLAAVPVGAQELTPIENPGPLVAEGPATQAKQPGNVYIVELTDAGAASYKGGTGGFAATKPGPGVRFDARAPAVETYTRYIEQKQDAVVAAVGGEKIYSYRYALNGFAARLTPDQVTRLVRRADVRHIWPDTYHELALNNASHFLGLLDQRGGLRADLGLTGENVVVAIIDSGIDPDHPALKDTEEHVPRTCRSDWAKGSWLGLMLCGALNRNPPTTTVYGPVVGFGGTCEAGEFFPATSCNNKLVGARFYNEGFDFRYERDPNEFFSPRDADGHGTHIATIVAANPDVAHLFGARLGEITGLAPRARLAVYKACWLKPGDDRATCATSDLARAIDDAVADGVDVINYSVGSLETDLTAPDDIALLNAWDAGVVSVVAAGNDGPDNYTIGSPGSGPWVITAGATTQSGTRYEEAIEVTAPVSFKDFAPMREASFTPRLKDLEPVEGPLVLADDGQDVLGDGGDGSYYDACEALVNGDEISGAIALIERGGCTFQAKLERVEAAGAIGAVVYTLSGDPIVMNGEPGSVDIPAVMIGTADGNGLVDAWFAGDEPAVRLAYGVVTNLRDTGDQMAVFSSRGPSISENDFIKPDLTAPGVDILGGSTPYIANGTRGEYYQYLSGTSMSTPMIAGIAALLREAKPDWSPGTIKSALMSTAVTDIVTADGQYTANSFDMGAGRVNADAALDPGLVVDTQKDDFDAYLCGLDSLVPSLDRCNALAAAGYSFEPEQLNLPSIGVNELIPGDTIVRTVTNIGPAATYSAAVEEPPGLSVTIEPSSLSLGTGETGQFRLHFDVTDAPLSYWQFGSVTWSDDTHSVRLPVAAQPVYVRAPRDLALPAESGSGVMRVDFGYTDTYTAAVHGLNAPGLDEQGVVANDPTRSFSFRFDNGVTGHFFTVPPDQLFLRVALFDAYTDGEDDLDLYLYHCPTLSTCTQIGESGSFTSQEAVDLLTPDPGLYAALVHGFQTDETSGGTGAVYRIFAWSFGPDEDRGNFSIEAPASVTRGDNLEFPYQWGPLDPDTIYLGAVSHNTPFDVFFLTIVTANAP